MVFDSVIIYSSSVLSPLEDWRLFLELSVLDYIFRHSCPLIQNVFTFAHLTKGGVNIMLIIPIKEGENIDRALKRYKRKFDKTKTVRQLRARTAFTSVKNRIKVQKAAIFKT
jgi:small subunit ribosomal protein S21